MLLTASQSALAQEAKPAEDSEPSTVQQFGGASSVPGQMADDKRLADAALTDVTLPQTYSDWKESQREKRALDSTVDKKPTAIKATNTINNYEFYACGVVRI